MISIIVPCYNEEENVALYPETLLPVARSVAEKYGETCEFVLVDDGSRDSTLARLNELQKSNAGVTVVPHGTNKGMGAAIRTGLSRCRGDLIIMMDSDLSYRPEDTGILLAAYRESGADCIAGSPYREKGLTDKVSSPFRLFMSWSVNILYRILLWSDITCVSGIFRLYRKPALDGLVLESNTFEICAEILTKLILGKKSIKEVGVRLHARKFGKSKLNVRKEIVNNLRILWKIFRARFFRQAWK